jgi:hypothetical protein
MRIWLALAAAALFALKAVTALASDHDPNSGRPLPPDRKHKTPSPINDRFYVEGIFYPVHVKTIVRIDPRGGAAGQVGTTVSAERDLGQPSRLNQGMLEMMFRLRERNRIRVNYYEVNRDTTHPLAETIQFGDQTFTANALLSSQIDWRIFGLTYTYSIIRNDRFELGTGLAAYLVQAQAQAQAQVNATQQRQQVSGAGAFPTVPLDLTFRISQRWAVTWRGQYFHAALHNFDGWLADIHEDVQYRWKPNFAIGVGYASIRAQLTLQTGHFPGTFSTSLQGPEAFFRVSF